ncbi:MAG: hypothetical protein WBB55_06910 [Anaerolineales bacterium]
MKIVYEYSHLGGSEILQVQYPEILQEIFDVIKSVSTKRTKISKEKTMKGRRLYSPRDMNSQFRKEFDEREFRELRDTYTITLPDSKTIITKA